MGCETLKPPWTSRNGTKAKCVCVCVCACFFVGIFWAEENDTYIVGVSGYWRLIWREVAVKSGRVAGVRIPLPYDVLRRWDCLEGEGLGHADTLHSHLMQHTPHLRQAVLADVNRKEGEAVWEGGGARGGGGTYGGMAPVVQDVLEVGAGRQDEVVPPLVPVDLQSPILVHSATPSCPLHKLSVMVGSFPVG